jgi:hypothetical protein
MHTAKDRLVDQISDLRPDECTDDARRAGEQRDLPDDPVRPHVSDLSR